MIEIENWGLIDYKEAWDRQKELVAEISEKRDRNVLVLCQHPTVITIGRNGSEDNITVDKTFLERSGIPVYEIDRGGDVTLHNPGQLVGYPIFNLSSMREDLHWFLREIEEAIIEIVGKYGIEAGRVEGLTGVWVDGVRKICAIGMHSRRWVTYHGFALNVINHISEFNYIVPCGIQDKAVTSIEVESTQNIDFDDVVKTAMKVFSKKF